jgi:AraC-like DNA-binding protein
MQVENGLMDIFFAFPDGVFHHVCAECTALCCRGQGFAGSLKREMNFVFRNYPPLASLVTEREGDIVTVATPAGRCFFLRNDNLCQIELDHGRARKPGICLLFPFNDFSRIGNTLVVAPHFMCPLRLNLPAAPGKVEGTHANVAKAIKETNLGESDYVRGFVGTAKLPPGKTASEVLDRERKFCDRCTESLGKSQFRDVLAASSENASALWAFRKRVAKLLGWTIPAQQASRDELDDILIASAPAYRVESLFLSDEALLRFLALSELLVRRAFSMSIGSPTLQGAYGVIEDMRPALRLLAWGDAKPPLKKVSFKSPEFGDTNLVDSAQKFLNWLPVKGVLPALEKALPPKFSAADRIVVIRQSADTVEPAIRRTAGQ